MLVRVTCFLFLLCTGISVFAGQEHDGYTRLLCAVLESSNSEDPEIRSNAVVEGLAYLDGETADVLRLLLLFKEDVPVIREALLRQLSGSTRKSDAVEYLRNLAQNLPSPERKTEIQVQAEALRQASSAPGVDGAKVHKEPRQYSGPLSGVQINLLNDSVARSRIYEKLGKQQGRSSWEILQLFRAVETDPYLKKDISQRLGKKEAGRSEDRKSGQN